MERPGGPGWRRLVALARVLLACVLAAQTAAAFALAAYFLAYTVVANSPANRDSTPLAGIAVALGIMGTIAFGAVAVVLGVLLRRHLRRGGAEPALAAVELAMVAVSLTISEASPWTLPVRATAFAILILAVMTAAGSRGQPVTPRRREVTRRIGDPPPRAYRPPFR